MFYIAVAFCASALFLGCNKSSPSTDISAKPEITFIKEALDKEHEPLTNKYTLVGNNLEGGKVTLAEDQTQELIPVIKTIHTKATRIRFEVSTDLLERLKTKSRFVLSVETPKGRISKDVEIFHCKNNGVCIGLMLPQQDQTQPLLPVKAPVAPVKRNQAADEHHIDPGGHAAPGPSRMLWLPKIDFAQYGQTGKWFRHL